MSEELLTAARYRVHAEEVRVIAETMNDANTRRVLIGVAADYDHMATTLEQIAKSDADRSPKC